jgi:hypothetical protein
MNESEIILAEFKNADDEHQLSLYMYHRNLRSDFEQIENEEKNSLELETAFAQQDVIIPGKTKDRQSTFIKLKRWCFSLLS